jgi:hypothetical protein
MSVRVATQLYSWVPSPDQRRCRLWTVSATAEVVRRRSRQTGAAWRGPVVGEIAGLSIPGLTRHAGLVIQP